MSDGNARVLRPGHRIALGQDAYTVIQLNGRMAGSPSSTRPSSDASAGLKDTSLNWRRDAIRNGRRALIMILTCTPRRSVSW